MKGFPLLPCLNDRSSLLENLSRVHTLLCQNPHCLKHTKQTLLQGVIGLFNIYLLLQLNNVNVHG